jgi:hypothetical protein
MTNAVNKSFQIMGRYNSTLQLTDP